MRVRSSLPAVMGIGACAAMIFNILPAFLGKAVETFALDDSAAGWLATAYLGGFGLASVGSAFWLHRVDRRRTVAGSLLGAMALLALAAFADTYLELLTALSLAGLFLGTLYSLSFVLAGEFEDPVRAVGFKLGGEVGLGALLIFALPVLVFPAFGFAGMLAALAAILLLATPLALAVSPGAQPAAAAGQGAAATGMLPLAAILGLAVLLAFTVGQSALWTFIERAGVRAGYDAAALSIALSGAVLMGGLGALAAAVTGRHVGKTAPVIFAILVYGAAVSALLFGQGFAVFAAGVNLFFFIWLFALPYFAAGIALADPSGRGTSLISACFAFGSMAGPVLAGRLVAGDDFSLLYLCSAALVLASLLTLLTLLLRMRR